MESFKILIKQYTTKDGTRKFTAANVKGSYLPESVKADAETWYKLRPVMTMIPTEEGVYTVECEKVWIDRRPEYKDKNIVRIKGSITFTKN